jgi:hypothetical protein
MSVAPSHKDQMLSHIALRFYRTIGLPVSSSSPGGDCRTDQGSDDHGHDRIAPQGSARLEINTHQIQAESGQGPDGTSNKPLHLAPL